MQMGQEVAWLLPPAGLQTADPSGRSKPPRAVQCSISCIVDQPLQRSMHLDSFQLGEEAGKGRVMARRTAYEWKCFPS